MLSDCIIYDVPHLVFGKRKIEIFNYPVTFTALAMICQVVECTQTCQNFALVEFEVY